MGTADVGTPIPPDLQARLEIYKILVEMADRVSQRRQAANSFYLSVNTAIVGASALVPHLNSTNPPVALIALAGFCVSALWVRNIESYKELNEGKFHVITEMEKLLPEKAFTDEWAYLHRSGKQKKYRPFHTVEIAVPWVFMIVSFLQFVTLTNWTVVFTTTQSFFRGLFG